MESRIEVVAFASPLVTIEPFDSSTHASFIPVLERLQCPRAGEVGAVVTNRALLGIEVLVTRWSKPILATGRPKHLVAEGFSNPPYLPVLSSGGRKLATDARFFPETLPERFVSIGGSPTGSYRRVEIDSAIFEDGTMAGPDRFRVVSYIREQRSTVEELLALVDIGSRQGWSIERILSDFETVPDSTRRQWRRFLAYSVRRNRSFIDYLRRQRPLPHAFPR